MVKLSLWKELDWDWKCGVFSLLFTGSKNTECVVQSSLDRKLVGTWSHLTFSWGEVWKAAIELRCVLHNICETFPCSVTQSGSSLTSPTTLTNTPCGIKLCVIFLLTQKGRRSLPRHICGFICRGQLTGLLLLVEHGRLHRERCTGAHYWPSPDWTQTRHWRIRTSGTCYSCVIIAEVRVLTYLYNTALSTPNAPTTRSARGESSVKASYMKVSAETVVVGCSL